MAFLQASKLEDRRKVENLILKCLRNEESDLLEMEAKANNTENGHVS
jgi:hypothetical protein